MPGIAARKVPHLVSQLFIHAPVKLHSSLPAANPAASPDP